MFLLNLERSLIDHKIFAIFILEKDFVIVKIIVNFVVSNPNGDEEQKNGGRKLKNLS